MLSNFLIGLREGLEAALIVGILVAYIVKTNQPSKRELLTAVWSGVAIAISASLALGGFLSFTSAELTPRGEEFFAGSTSFLAVGLVTWMVFWMKRTARSLREDLHGKVATALSSGPITLAAAAFFAVLREGLETSLFVYANFRSINGEGVGAGPAIGLTVGLAVAVFLGWAIYRRAITLNLATFFKITGVALIVIAAGVLSYGVHEFQELGWIPGADLFIWDTTSWMSKESIPGSILAGTIGFDTTTSWWQFGFWGLYLLITLKAYLAPARKSVAL
ncbi:MAG: FTR1 family iron permease [Candidatus Nanopelagicaceae bacterium]|nr:FTR1 family iron permease [Candidatus Nanopelagicaceae bacterium]